jgi:hypothetical protein
MHMEATAYGEGHVSPTPSPIERFARWFDALLQTRPR